MPHTISSTPFLSLQHDASCGRTESDLVVNSSGDAPFSSLSSPRTNGLTPADVRHIANGASKASQKLGSDEFLKLSQPQQDVLLLHGPGKRYSLERAQQIPTLRHDREILVQVLAIGLNPIDWKGPDYGSP